VLRAFRNRYSSFTVSHISIEIWSRTMRAFSRAAKTQARIELGLRRSKAKNSVTERLSELS